jgi:Glycosyl hydrolases family 39.
MKNNIHVDIEVDAGRVVKDLPHSWKYIGYDECNYTHAPQGEALLDSFGSLEDAPYYVRTHHLLCTGNSLGTYKWGSTNVYTEDENHNPVYNFEVFDTVIDVILKSHNKPFVEFGFMPMDLVDPALSEDLSVWEKYGFYVQKGHTYPPKDYKKWHDLICWLAQHCLDRYGRQEVSTWYWELWNEPDLSFYWGGTIEDYCRLYDYTADALHTVLPEARLAGPATTAPEPGSKSLAFLEAFLNHCSDGVNFVTGEKGSRLDYITFHVKGGGYAFDMNAKKETPSVKLFAERLTLGLETIAKHGFRDLEVVLSEADPDGWAAGGLYDNSNFKFRNTEYYASYMASTYHHIQKIAGSMQMKVRPLAWAFMFVGERCFEGTRTFSTQGIKKTSFNLFRIFAKIGNRELQFKSSQEKDVLNYADYFATTEEPEVSGLASLDDQGNLQILIYSHHDDWDNNQEFTVSLEVRNLPFAGRVKCGHYRVDGEHSNAYAEWVRQNKPQYPNERQYAAIKERDGLEQFEPVRQMSPTNHDLKLEFVMPSHAVSLIEISGLG